MADAANVEITTTRTIRIDDYVFHERQDCPGVFSFKQERSIDGSIPDAKWSSHIRAETAREMAAALNAFADTTEEKS